MSLIVECKKSSKPWVFYVREKKGLRIFHPIAASGLIKLESKPWLHPLHFEKVVDCFHYYFPEFETIAVIPYEPFTKEKSSTIFEAKSQVIKSLLYERERNRKFCLTEEAKEKARTNFKTTNIVIVVYPLVIFDGHLYKLEYFKDKPKLTLSKYIQYLTSFGFPTAEDFVIDIVEIGFLKEYLEMLDKGMEQFAKKIASLRFPSEPPAKRS